MVGGGHREKFQYGSNFNLLNQDQVGRLMEYVLNTCNVNYDLRAVNDMGGCMFVLVRRGINVPAEYTNAHFRRQLMMFMLQYKKYFYSFWKLWRKKTASVHV